MIGSRHPLYYAKQPLYYAINSVMLGTHSIMQGTHSIMLGTYSKSSIIQAGTTCTVYAFILYCVQRTTKRKVDPTRFMQ